MSNDQNQLTTTNPLSFNDLLEKDPEEYNDQDLNTIVEAYRLHRRTYLNVKAKGQTPSKANTKNPIHEDLPSVDDLLGGM